MKCYFFEDENGLKAGNWSGSFEPSVNFNEFTDEQYALVAGYEHYVGGEYTKVSGTIQNPHIEIDKTLLDIEIDKNQILSTIRRFEMLETPRRIAEAALETVLTNEHDLTCGDAAVLPYGSTGKDWLQYNRDLISVEREKL